MTRWLGVCLFLGLQATVAHAADAAATLQRAKGRVHIQAPGKSETPAKAGQALEAGTRVRTEAKSNAEIQFADGSVLKVRPKSSLKLSGHKRKTRPKTSVVLFFGRVWNKVQKAVGATPNYEVTTANAVCGVRGTEFETAVADDGLIRVEVTNGKVAVGSGSEGDEQVGEGQYVEGDEDGVGDAGAAEEAQKLATWEKRKRQRLKKNAKGIVDDVRGKIMQKKGRLEELRARQKSIEEKRKAAEARAKQGDRDAIEQIRSYNEELSVIADDIADLADMAESQFGLVDHFADLAGDPRFGMIDRKYIESQAASLRRVKADLDAMVAEGTDISVEAMNKMLDDIGKGERGSLKDERGSSVDDLFDKGEMDMNMDDMKP